MEEVPYSSDPETIWAMSEQSTVVRDYVTYDTCPLDDAPDIFFRDLDNPDLTLGGDVLETEYYALGQTLTVEEVTESEYTVTLTALDWGGGARLKAEVMMNGVWVPAGADGPTADGDYLMVPVDADTDGIADAWEQPDDLDPMADDDAYREFGPTPNAGDGLTAIEEYRGVYVNHSGAPEHRRLMTSVRDLFVYDYTGALDTDLRVVSRAMLEQDIFLWRIDELGQFNDVINFSSRAPQKTGDQHILVTMENPTTPADVGWRRFYDDWAFWSGRASSVGPPTSRHHTVLLQHNLISRGLTDSRAGTVAHEIGHQLNVWHHGDTGGWVTDPSTGTMQMVAVPGGQHSGAHNCFMRYLRATLFCDGSDASACASDSSYVPYACGSSGTASSVLAIALGGDDPCAAVRETFCRTPSGSGINADGGWSGDASPGRGNCADQITIRSY